MTFAKIKSISRLIVLIIVTNSFAKCISHSQNDNNKSLAGMYKLYRIEEHKIQVEYGDNQIGQKEEKVILFMTG